MNATLSASMDRRMTPFQVFASAVAIASFGGIAALLRSNQPLTTRTVLSATIYSGAAGLIIALLWFNSYGNQGGNPYFLLGICGLAGIGGVDALELIIRGLQKGLLTLKRPDGGPTPGDGNGNVQ